MDQSEKQRSFATNILFMPNQPIIMPVYNGEAYFHQIIDRILKQSFLGFKFIIIDDASTDSLEKVIHSYKDPQTFRLYKKSKGVILMRYARKAILGFITRYKSVKQSTPDEWALRWDGIKIDHFLDNLWKSLI